MRKPLLPLLFSLLALVVLNFTLTTIASPYIVFDLGGDRTITFYGLCFFGFGSAITIPLSKPLTSKFGLNKVIFTSIALFSLGNLCAALAPTYFFLIVFRFLTGFAVGPFYALLPQYFPRGKSSISWIFITTMVLMPVVGACLGGVGAYLYNWRFLFFFSSILSFLLICLASLFFGEITPSFKPISFDWIDWLFYAISLLCLTFVIATVQEFDWYRSPLLIAATLIGLPCLLFFLLRTYYSETPILNLRLLAKPIFFLALLSLFILFATYFGIILLLGIWLSLDVQFTPDWIALLIGTMGIAALFPYFILEGRLKKIDPRIFIAIATAFFALSCFYTTVFNPEINFGRVAFSRVIAGFGLALFLPPIFEIVSQSFPTEKTIDAFELFQTTRNLACGIGAAVFNIIWQRRTVFYHERLSERLTPQSNNVQLFLDQFATLHVPGDPLAQLNLYLNRQASSLALNDTFYLMGWILVALFVILALTYFIQPHLFNLEKAKSPSP